MMGDGITPKSKARSMQPLISPASVASALISLTLAKPAFLIFRCTCSMASGWGSMAYSWPVSPSNSAADVVKNPVPQPISKTSWPDRLPARSRIVTGSANR
jgi:hypothetical protein